MNNGRPGANLLTSPSKERHLRLRASKVRIDDWTVFPGAAPDAIVWNSKDAVAIGDSEGPRC